MLVLVLVERELAKWGQVVQVEVGCRGVPTHLAPSKHICIWHLHCILHLAHQMSTLFPILTTFLIMTHTLSILHNVATCVNLTTSHLVLPIIIIV